MSSQTRSTEFESSAHPRRHPRQRRRRSRSTRPPGEFSEFMTATKSVRTVISNLLITGILAFGIYWLSVILLTGPNATSNADGTAATAPLATPPSEIASATSSALTTAQPDDQSTPGDSVEKTQTQPELFIVNAYQASIFASIDDSDTTGKPLTHGMILRLLERDDSWSKVSVVATGQVGFVHNSMVGPLKP